MKALWIPGSVSKQPAATVSRAPVSILPKIRNLRLREESKADPGDRAVARQVEVEA